MRGLCGECRCAKKRIEWRVNSVKDVNKHQALLDFPETTYKFFDTAMAEVLEF